MIITTRMPAVWHAAIDPLSSSGELAGRLGDLLVIERGWTFLGEHLGAHPEHPFGCALDEDDVERSYRSMSSTCVAALGPATGDSDLVG